MPLPQYQAKHLKGQKRANIPRANLIIGWLDMRGPGMEKNLRQGIAPKIGNGLKGMAMGDNMVLEKRKG